MLGARSLVFQLQFVNPVVISPEFVTPEGHGSGVKTQHKGTSMNKNRAISNSRNKLYLSVITAIICASSTSSLYAQANEANSEGMLEEVIVTATKRQESIQDVPISIATLSG